MNLEKSLLSKWKNLKPYVDLILTISDEDVLLFKYIQAMTMYKDSKISIMTVIKLMEKKTFRAPYFIDQVIGTFGLRGSSFSEANHSSVNFLIIQHTKGIYGVIQELTKRQKSLMMKNRSIICLEF